MTEQITKLQKLKTSNSYEHKM